MAGDMGLYGLSIGGGGGGGAAVEDDGPVGSSSSESSKGLACCRVDATAAMVVCV